jgi:hypothetical protein
MRVVKQVSGARGRTRIAARRRAEQNNIGKGFGFGVEI